MEFAQTRRMRTFAQIVKRERERERERIFPQEEPQKEGPKAILFFLFKSEYNMVSRELHLTP
jgi:hypothetical protein